MDTDDFTLDASTAGLSMVWAGSRELPLSPTYELAGRIRLIDAPAAANAGATTLGRNQRLELADASLRSGPNRLETSGFIDFGRQRLSLDASGSIAGLADFLRPFGVEGLDGDLHVQGARVRGRFDDPSVRAQVKLTDARLLGQVVGRISAGVDLKGGLLRILDLRAKADWGRLTATGDIRLWRDSLTRLDEQLLFHLAELSVEDFAIHRLLPGLGLVASLDLRAANVSGAAADPLRTLRGDGSLKATDVTWGGERARRVGARMKATRTHLAVDKAFVLLASGDRIQGSLKLRKHDHGLSANVRATDLPFSAFEYFEAEELPFRGRISTDLTIEGTLEAPLVIGTVSGRDFGFGPVFLGDGSYTLTPGPDGRVNAAATGNFPGLELLDGSYVQLSGGRPEHLEIHAAARRADIFAVLPFLELPNMRAYLGRERDPQKSGEEPTARGRFDLWPFRDEDAWRLEIEAAPGDAILELYGGEIVYDNTSPLTVVQDGHGTTFAPVTLAHDGASPLTVCGHVGLDTELDIQVTGRLDLEVVRLREVFSSLDGTLRVGADPEVAQRLGGRGCLPAGTTRVLHVTGAAERPVAAGRLVAEEARVVPRSFGREVRVVPGTGVTLRSGDQPGRQVVVLDAAPGRRLRGELDDGQFGVEGTIELLDFGLDAANLRLDGTDLFHAVAGELTLTFNPDLSLVVTDFADSQNRSLVLTGDVLITEGLYYRSFDSLGKALDSIGGKSATSFSAPVTETVPWLADLRLDLEIVGSNTALRSAFPLGETDLETRLDLRIQGGLDDLEVYRRIDILPGGTVGYQLFEREFEIVSGTVDFDGDPGRARIDIVAQTEVTYYETIDPETQREEERTVIISLLVSGRLPTPDVQLTSDDRSFDQGDLQSLLLTGKPRGVERSRDNELFSLDLAGLVSAILKAPFIDDVNVTLTQTGGTGIGLGTVFGRMLKLRTRAVQETTETRVSAGFEFRISDAISMEGRLLRIDSTTSPSQTYEARLKYRIPLD